MYCYTKVQDGCVTYRFACDCFIQFARKFYIAQWYRDSTSEAEKALKSQNEKDDDWTSQCLSNEMDSTGEIMQKTEARKKFLRKVIRMSSSQFR